MGKFSLNVREARETGKKEKLVKVDKKLEQKRSQKSHFEEIFNRR
jgi:hypothetical protein